MNLYIVVEGECTETELYPRWISYRIPELIQVSSFRDVATNNYYLFSGGGIPSTYNHVKNAIEEINLNPVFDYLVVCLDGEDAGVERRKQKLIDYLNENNSVLNKKCTLKIIVQNACIETWFLGNRKIYKRNPQGALLRDYIAYYNIFDSDPELMGTYGDMPNKATFHHAYLRQIFKEHNLSYKKSRPKEVLSEKYLNELEKRVVQTDHLRSLEELFIFFEQLRKGLS